MFEKKNVFFSFYQTYQFYSRRIKRPTLFKIFFSNILFSALPVVQRLTCHPTYSVDEYEYNIFGYKLSEKCVANHKPSKYSLNSNLYLIDSK